MVIDWPSALNIADEVLFAGGVLVVLVATACWLKGGRRNPLADAPARPNAVLLEGILVPMCVWLLTASLLAGESNGGPGRLATWSSSAQAILESLPSVAGGLACLWVASRCFRGGVREFVLGWGGADRSAISACAYFLAAMAVCPILYHSTLWMIRFVVEQYPVLPHEVIETLRRRQTPLWVFWIGTVVIAPVAEECFFRGIVQTGLSNVFANRWWSVVTTAAIFGAVHAGGAAESPQPHVVPALAAFGLLIGVLYVRSGSLVGPIVLHALFNGKTLLWETIRQF